MTTEERKYYAHSVDNRPAKDWQLLKDHLKAVAELSAKFAGDFECADWGYLAGRWHDLGKYQIEFQRRLAGAKIAVEHSGIGAVLAFNKNHEAGLPLAFVIAGHHAGLANLAVASPDAPTPLMQRISRNRELLPKVLSEIPKNISEMSFPCLPDFLSERASASERDLIRRRYEFWIRFLLSAVVDADRLDTEAFCDPKKAILRSAVSEIPRLCRNLDNYLNEKISAIPESFRNSTVNRARAEVLSACRRSASMPRGAFALTVPTGGGKTLSSLAFALGHAEHHDLRRVIIVLPYTSIIEQNAAEYRRALGEDKVVEHHANLDPEVMKREYGEERVLRHELACENWDAPVIITTTVQFFESLFASQPSRCRKLHNISRSVIILDEVQTLPSQYLLSILDGLNELITHYGCSLVLSTATPPSLAYRERFPAGLRNITEIISDPAVLGEKLKRVEYSWPGPDAPAIEWPALAEELARHHQVLAIVHKRKDARMLTQLLHDKIKDGNVFHLSALMCPAHRSAVIAKIKRTLERGEPCRVVSTQLIEAGVDIDFPVVYRALGGLDSIVQAAGRCNREGKRDKGMVIIFRAPSAPPGGTPRKALETTETILREANGKIDPIDPKMFDKYFRMLYLIERTDAHNIQVLRQEFNFAEVARQFKIIEDGYMRPVIVPYADASQRLANLQTTGINRSALRSLQPFIVNIHPKAFEMLFRSGALQEAIEGVYCLSPVFPDLYRKDYGLMVDEQPLADPSKLMV